MLLKCGACGYQSDGDTCPECGNTCYTWEEFAQAALIRKRWRAVRLRQCAAAGLIFAASNIVFLAGGHGAAPAGFAVAFMGHSIGWFLVGAAMILA